MANTLADTAFARLEAEGRLLNSVLKGPTHKPGRFGFRGDLALKFPAKFADEARPPELSAEQVIAAAHVGEPHLALCCGFLLSYASLQLVVDVLGELLSPRGKYFFFCDNVDLAARYQVDFGGVSVYVLPIDEATVYNEMLELLRLDKTELKRLDTAGKTDAIVERALAFGERFQAMDFEQGLALADPVRNPYENRPV